MFRSESITADLFCWEKKYEKSFNVTRLGLIDNVWNVFIIATIHRFISSLRRVPSPI